MFWNRVRILLVACILVAAAAVQARAGGCADGSCGAAAPIVDGGCAAPAPAYRTIRVTELQPQQYTATRTVYRAETTQETYTAYRTEYTQEQRTRTYTVNRMVPECQTRFRTVCVNVPVCEERVCYEKRTCWKPVTHMVRKCVDQGHWECQLVEHKSLFERLGLHRRKCCDPCDPCCCEPVKYKTVKKWVPCKVWVECPVTRRERVCETVPVVKKVHSCRKEYRQEAYTVTVCKCVPEVKTECYTVCVPKCVPYTATRWVTRCVPHCETYTACKMVPVCVEKQVPVCCDPCEVCCKKRFWSR